MHVLGTPPAFVLSQDQTLKKLYLNSLSAAQIIFQVICSSKFYSRIFVGLNSITRNLNNSFIVQGVTCSSLRYSICKVHSPFASQRTLTYYHKLFGLSSTFFNFLKISFCAPQRRSDMHYKAATRKSQAKFCQKSAKKRGPNGPRICIFLLKPYLRSGHSRHRCAYTPQQRHLHCPHPGKRRNYAPADSSAARPPHGAWA